MTAPCRDCPDRSEACHDRCEKYQTYREWRVEYNRLRRESYISKWSYNDAAVQAFRKKLNNYKRNH